MDGYPLLIFPEPGHAGKAKRDVRGPKIRLPEPQRQAERLAPQFQRLQQAMDQRRLTLQDNTLGLQPEQVLVLETIGPVQNFINAVKKIEGLEWLGEFELDDIAPDCGFEDEKKPQKSLRGQLFLVMTDQQAQQRLLGLYHRWHQNQNIQFPAGLAPFKHAFEHLHTIRPWDAEDRIRDTGILEDWQERVKYEQKDVPFELELWFRENGGRRQQTKAYLEVVVNDLGGKIVQQCVIPEISYHGILGKIPSAGVANMLSEISKLRDFRLLQCEDIMFMRPVGQCAIRVPEGLTDTQTFTQDGRVNPPTGKPVVALFDGLPLTRHQLLDERLIVDDPDGYESDYQARERVHGTAMASLICRGDLDEGGDPVSKPVYVRPIMQPFRDFNGQSVERIPEEVLAVDLIHRAVRRLYESKEEEPAVAPSVRIINLSVCDKLHPFERGMSSWARLLDWLSWKYNVLFIVSAGNHPWDIELNIPRAELQSLSAEEREIAVVEAIAADTRNRRLLSPAETVNGLTVGASHTDASTPRISPSLIDPFSRVGLPCTFSAHGPGYRRAIKPDLFLPGGRQYLSEKLGSVHPKAVLQTTYFTSPPGQSVAAPGPSGELDRAMYTRGTSNSTALATRWATFLLEVIDRLRSQHGAALPPEYDVVLLKALLVHGTDWEDAGAVYESILKNPQNSKIFQDYVGRFLGYGSANVRKVIDCTEQRVTVLGVGKLADAEGDEFYFPFPPSLSAVTDRRRLTITLAWLSPMDCARQNYRIAHLWFDPKNELAPVRICANNKAVLRGTVQHEVLEGAMAVGFQDGDGITIKVSCRADAGDILDQIRYGLVVTLEVAEGINIPIYQEIRDRLRIRVPITE